MAIWEHIGISLLTTIVVTIVVYFVKPLKVWFFKHVPIYFLKRDIGTRYYYKFNKDKIYIFPKEQETRISVSVLARIENKNGEFLLKSKYSETTRQDNIYKPLGGAIKISNNMNKKLKNYLIDQKTRYSAKDRDFRIFMNLNNNKIIHKALYKERLYYYKNELIREISEEMLIEEGEVSKIFSFKQNQPIVIHVNHTEKDFSYLDVNDYVHHIVFDLEIKDEEKFEKVKNNNKKAKINFINLNGQENKSITSLILNIRKPIHKFDE